MIPGALWCSLGGGDLTWTGAWCPGASSTCASTSSRSTSPKDCWGLGFRVQAGDREGSGFRVWEEVGIQSSWRRDARPRMQHDA